MPKRIKIFKTKDKNKYPLNQNFLQTILLTTPV